MANPTRDYFDVTFYHHPALYDWGMRLWFRAYGGLGNVIQNVVREAAPLPAERWLDLCCGTGNLARAVTITMGSQGLVVGIDFALPMLQLARRKIPMGFQAAQSDAGTLPFADESFE